MRAGKLSHRAAVQGAARPVFDMQDLTHRLFKAVPPNGGNGLLWILLAVAGIFAFLQPRSPAQWLELVDWSTVGALAGLLAITQGVEQCGALQSVARRVLAHARDQRQLAFMLVASAALLAALVTNDVSLFLLVPLTRVLAAKARLPVLRLVVLEALAVNAGSSLTPIGNPQNLYLWHLSGKGFVAYIGMMLPTVLVMLLCVAAAVWWLVPRTPIALAPVPEDQPVRLPLLALSAILFVAFVVALDQDQVLLGLGLVGGAYGLLHARVLLRIDWVLLVIIALMFIDLHQAAQLPLVAQILGQPALAHGWRASLTAVVTAQLISNVPATVLLTNYVQDIPALAVGVNLGGFGCVIGSLANLIALRLAQQPGALREFHKISVPFLVVCTGLALLLVGAST